MEIAASLYRSYVFRFPVWRAFLLEKALWRRLASVNGVALLTIPAMALRSQLLIFSDCTET